MRGGAVAVYYFTVVFEEGDIVGRCLNTKGNALLIVHLDSRPSHVVFDARTVDAGMEIVAYFVSVPFGQFAAEEGSHMIRFHGVYGSAHQLPIDGCKVFLLLEDDVGGILGLHDGPVVGGGKVADDGTVLLDDVVELPVKAVRADGSSQLLGTFWVVDLDENVVEQGVADAFFVHFSGKFVVPVEIELQAEGCPSWHSQIAESQIGQDEVVVVVQALAGGWFEEGVTGLLVMPGFERCAGFHCRQDVDQSWVAATLGNDGADAFFFAEVSLADEVYFETMFPGDGLSMLTQLQTKVVNPVWVIENGQAKTAEETSHGSRMPYVNQCSGQDKAVIARETEGDLIGMAFCEKFHALTIQPRSKNIQDLVPAMPG